MTSATALELVDFAKRLGAVPRTDARFLTVLTDNIPKRWRWLALHRRLLRVAFLVRPDWLPDSRALRVAAEVASERTSTAEYVTRDVFERFERQFGPISTLWESPDDRRIEQERLAELRAKA